MHFKPKAITRVNIKPRGSPMLAGVWANEDSLMQTYMLYVDLSWDIFDGRWKVDFGS